VRKKWRAYIRIEIQSAAKYNNFRGRCAVRIPKVYLETSVFNFVFADGAPDRKRDALKLFEEISENILNPRSRQKLRSAETTKQPERSDYLSHPLLSAARFRLSGA
jgi:hypothetical protein